MRSWFEINTQCSKLLIIWASMVLPIFINFFGVNLEVHQSNCAEKSNNIQNWFRDIQRHRFLAANIVLAWC